MNNIFFDEWFLNSTKTHYLYKDLNDMNDTELLILAKFILDYTQGKLLCGRNKSSSDTKIKNLKVFFNTYSLWHYHLSQSVCSSQDCKLKTKCSAFGINENLSGYTDSKIIHYINNINKHNNITVITFSPIHNPFTPLDKKPLYDRVKKAYHKNKIKDIVDFFNSIKK